MSFNRLAIHGAAWTFIGYGVGQVLRLVSNLVLTRLLAPELFGVMALVNVVVIGLNMFTDVGIGINIIQSERGEEKNFLNTAWTIQIIRGIIICIICILGALPFSYFYNEPSLVWILPATGLSVIISGFNSTSLYTLNRKMDLKRITILEIGTQVSTIGVMLITALIYPTIWVLVGGNIFGAFIKMIISHIWLDNFKNKFCLESSSVSQLIRFGKWIFVSTVLSFAFNSSGSLILGKLSNMSDLGVFTIASTLAKAVENIFDQIGGRVLLPVYSRLKLLSVNELKKEITRIRLVLLVVFLPFLWIFIFFGQDIVNLLLDSRYSQAGWIFRVLSAGIIFTIIGDMGQYFLAIGNSYMAMLLSAVKLLFFLLSMVIGFYFYGYPGVIIGMSVHNVFLCAFGMLIQKKYGILTLKLNIIAIIMSVIIIFGSFYLKPISL